VLKEAVDAIGAMLGLCVGSLLLEKLLLIKVALIIILQLSR